MRKPTKVTITDSTFHKVGVAAVITGMDEVQWERNTVTESGRGLVVRDASPEHRPIKLPDEILREIMHHYSENRSGTPEKRVDEAISASGSIKKWAADNGVALTQLAVDLTQWVLRSGGG